MPKIKEIFRERNLNSLVKTTRHTNIPCPFCSLLCDDLVIKNDNGVIRAEKNACAKAVQQFSRSNPSNQAKIHGKDATFEEACTYAAAILKKTQHPLFAGLGTDVDGNRAVLSIAEQTGGVVGHMLEEGMSANFRVLQDRGWIASTLTEVRNRADLIILVGINMDTFPRFFERIVLNKSALVASNLKNRAVIYIGEGLTSTQLKSLQGIKVNQLKCKNQYIGEVLATIRALVTNRSLQVKKVAGLKMDDLQKLSQKMLAANYGVLVWNPADLCAPNADLTIHTICGLVEDINVTNRFVTLPISGNEGGMSAAGVCAWQSGYPLRVSFAKGYPEYDFRYSIQNLLDRHAVDAMVWISSISKGIQPYKTDIPVIALTTPAMRFKHTPAVYIPVGTAGIDHHGRMIRCDSVVTQRLAQLRVSNLPMLSSVLQKIQAIL